MNAIGYDLDTGGMLSMLPCGMPFSAPIQSVPARKTVRMGSTEKSAFVPKGSAFSQSRRALLRTQVRVGLDAALAAIQNHPERLSGIVGEPVVSQTSIDDATSLLVDKLNKGLASTATLLHDSKPNPDYVSDTDYIGPTSATNYIDPSTIMPGEAANPGREAKALVEWIFEAASGGACTEEITDIYGNSYPTVSDGKGWCVARDKYDNKVGAYPDPAENLKGDWIITVVGYGLRFVERVVDWCGDFLSTPGGKLATVGLGAAAVGGVMALVGVAASAVVAAVALGGILFVIGIIWWIAGGGNDDDSSAENDGYDNDGDGQVDEDGEEDPDDEVAVYDDTDPWGATREYPGGSGPFCPRAILNRVRFIPTMLVTV